MRCSVVVPCWVTATGVSGVRPAAISAFATSPISLGGRQQHQRGGARAERRPVDAALGDVDDPHLAVLGRRSAGCRRRPGPRRRRDAGHDLERDAGLGAAGRLLGAGGVEERVAVEQPDDVAAGLAALTTSAGPHGVAQRLAVVTERPVDDLDVGPAEPPDERRRPATR